MVSDVDPILLELHAEGTASGLLLRLVGLRSNQLPDKAIDLIDEAGARVKLRQTSDSE